MRGVKQSPATVIAVVALVVALGGTATAASQYLITSPSQVKPNVIARIASAARGEISTVQSKWGISKAGETVAVATARCPQGDHVLSGGYVSTLAIGARVVTDGPTIGSRSWQVVVLGPGTGESQVRATAICSTVSR